MDHSKKLFVFLEHAWFGIQNCSALSLEEILRSLKANEHWVPELRGAEWDNLIDTFRDTELSSTGAVYDPKTKRVIFLKAVKINTNILSSEELASIYNDVSASSKSKFMPEIILSPRVLTNLNNILLYGFSFYPDGKYTDPETGETYSGESMRSRIDEGKYKILNEQEEYLTHKNIKIKLDIAYSDITEILIALEDILNKTGSLPYEFYKPEHILFYRRGDDAKEKIMILDYGFEAKLKSKVGIISPYLTVDHFTENAQLNEKTVASGISFLLSEMLTGKRAFENIDACLQKRISNESFLCCLPTDISHLYKKSTSYNPDERPSIAELRSFFGEPKRKLISRRKFLKRSAIATSSLAASSVMLYGWIRKDSNERTKEKLWKRYSGIRDDLDILIEASLSGSNFESASLEKVYRRFKNNFRKVYLDINLPGIDYAPGEVIAGDLFKWTIPELKYGSNRGYYQAILWRHIKDNWPMAKSENILEKCLLATQSILRDAEECIEIYSQTHVLPKLPMLTGVNKGIATFSDLGINKNELIDYSKKLSKIITRIISLENDSDNKTKRITDTSLITLSTYNENNPEYLELFSHSFEDYLFIPEFLFNLAKTDIHLINKYGLSTHSEYYKDAVKNTLRKLHVGKEFFSSAKYDLGGNLITKFVLENENPYFYIPFALFGMQRMLEVSALIQNQDYSYATDELKNVLLEYDSLYCNYARNELGLDTISDIRRITSENIHNQNALLKMAKSIRKINLIGYLAFRNNLNKSKHLNLTFQEIIPAIPSFVFTLPNLYLRRSPIGYFDLGSDNSVLRTDDLRNLSLLVYTIRNEYLLSEII